MKSLKMNGLSRLFSFILIAVILVCTVGFAVGGLQSNESPDPNNSGDIGNNTENTDENTDQNTDNTTDTNKENENGNNSESNPTLTPEPTPVKYYNTMTGVEVSESQSNCAPIGVVVDPCMPLYGISNSDITFEFPLENGKTRFLCYTTNYSSLWKIGSLTPTRSYISFTSNFVGGIVVSYGNDDIIKYSAWDASKIDLDISKIFDCYYAENTLYIYTSKDMIDSACTNKEITDISGYKNPPYKFSDTAVVGTIDAKTVTLPYSDSNETTLIYSNESNKYLLFKSGARKVDMLNGKNISYSNLFILFANTTTYETHNGSELVLDNVSGGTGYYISDGQATEIRWCVTDSGELEFRSLNGEILSVNRGNAYVSYFKASNSLKVKIS